VNTAFRLTYLSLLVGMAGFTVLYAARDFVGMTLGVIFSSYIGLLVGKSLGEMAEFDCETLAREAAHRRKLARLREMMQRLAKLQRSRRESEALAAAHLTLGETK